MGPKRESRQSSWGRSGFSEMAQTDALRTQVREYIIAHPEAKNADVMEATGCSMRTVSNVRALLRAEGAIPAAGDKRHAAPRVDPTQVIGDAGVGTFDPITGVDLTRAVGASLGEDVGADGTVEIDKLKKVLWRVVRTNRDDRIVVAAAGTLARIKQEESARPLGPGPPMTEDDAVERLVLLYRPVGLKIVFAALVKAFKAIEIVNTFMGWLNESRTKGAHSTVPQPAPAQSARASDNDAHGSPAQ